jgi:hypothetical protein
VNTVINTPQARLAGSIYLLLMVMLVAGWVQLLRRSPARRVVNDVSDY